MFEDHYIRSLTSSDLRDDARHLSTEALFAAAIASKTGLGLGPLLSRVKYADGTLRKGWEPGSSNLTRLLQLWRDIVLEKGKCRRWWPLRTEWDVDALHTLCLNVANGSLAYWIDSRCSDCQGAGQLRTRRLCPTCKGSGRAPIAPNASRLEQDLIADMVSDLEGVVTAHNMRAARIMRRRADVHSGGATDEIPAGHAVQNVARRAAVEAVDHAQRVVSKAVPGAQIALAHDGVGHIKTVKHDARDDDGNNV